MQVSSLWPSSAKCPLFPEAERDQGDLASGRARALQGVQAHAKKTLGKVQKVRILHI